MGSIKLAPAAATDIRDFKMCGGYVNRRSALVEQLNEGAFCDQS
jgi:hypothetical protein